MCKSHLQATLGVNSHRPYMQIPCIIIFGLIFFTSTPNHKPPPDKNTLRAKFMWAIYTPCVSNTHRKETSNLWAQTSAIQPISQEHQKLSTSSNRSPNTWLVLHRKSHRICSAPGAANPTAPGWTSTAKSPRRIRFHQIYRNTFPFEGWGEFNDKIYFGKSSRRKIPERSLKNRE